jgi:hypothetical protein
MRLGCQPEKISAVRFKVAIADADAALMASVGRLSEVMGILSRFTIKLNLTAMVEKFRILHRSSSIEIVN